MCCDTASKGALLRPLTPARRGAANAEYFPRAGGKHKNQTPQTHTIHIFQSTHPYLTLHHSKYKMGDKRRALRRSSCPGTSSRLTRVVLLVAIIFITTFYMNGIESPMTDPAPAPSLEKSSLSADDAALLARRAAAAAAAAAAVAATPGDGGIVQGERPPAATQPVVTVADDDIDDWTSATTTTVHASTTTRSGKQRQRVQTNAAVKDDGDGGQTAHDNNRFRDDATATDGDDDDNDDDDVTARKREQTNIKQARAAAAAERRGAAAENKREERRRRVVSSVRDHSRTGSPIYHSQFAPCLAVPCLGIALYCLALPCIALPLPCLVLPCLFLLSIITYLSTNSTLPFQPLAHPTSLSSSLSPPLFSDAKLQLRRRRRRGDMN
jgi:hypothetical protein